MATTSPVKKTETRRLDVDTWIAAALEMLAEHGIDGVRVELLARNLGVTKGSFYWHFKDRDTLHAAMLDSWRRRTTLGLIERLNRDLRPRERLLTLIRLPISGPKSEQAAAVELAIRLWGRRDPRPAAALTEVDELRTEYLAQLLRECGVAETESRSRAFLAYAYMMACAYRRIGPGLTNHQPYATLAICEKILLGEDHSS